MVHKIEGQYKEQLALLEKLKKIPSEKLRNTDIREMVFLTTLKKQIGLKLTQKEKNILKSWEMLK